MVVLKVIFAYAIWTVVLVIQKGAEAGISSLQELTLDPTCVKRFFESGGGQSFVCVCNSTYCDGQDALQPLSRYF